MPDYGIYQGPSINGGPWVFTYISSINYKYKYKYTYKFSGGSRISRRGCAESESCLSSSLSPPFLFLPLSFLPSLFPFFLPSLPLKSS